METVILTSEGNEVVGRCNELLVKASIYVTTYYMCSKSLNLGTNPPELQIIGSLIRTFTLASARSARFPSLKMPSKPSCPHRFHRIITKEINRKKKKWPLTLRIPVSVFCNSCDAPASCTPLQGSSSRVSKIVRKNRSKS